MSELFREIEEDIKRERFEKLWKSFGFAMVWASIALVAATVIFVLWQNHVQSAAEGKTSQLLRGIDRLQLEDYSGAVPIFSALTDDDSSPYYGIAMLRKAQAQELSGDKEGAQKTYSALSTKTSEFAGLAALKLDGSMSVAKDSPFYYTSAEYKAWGLLSSGKKAEAAAAFSELASDKNSPQTLADRAKEVLRTIAPEKPKNGKQDENE